MESIVERTWNRSWNPRGIARGILLEFALGIALGIDLGIARGMLELLVEFRNLSWNLRVFHGNSFKIMLKIKYQSQISKNMLEGLFLIDIQSLI